jgi:hypothetical protein
LQPDSLIPAPSNPQAWNRYSYVGNRPVNFNDPTGHKECETESNGGCMDSRKLKLWNYAADTLNELGKKDDLEAVARIVDKSAQLYSTFEKMMPALSEIFLGIEESNSLTIYHAWGVDKCAALGRDDCWANEESGVFFGDKGFHRDYQDGFSQPFHFWAYLATAANTEGNGPASYIPGRVVGNIANEVHERFAPPLVRLYYRDPSRVDIGSTWEDYALSRVGMNIGTLVNIGAVGPSRLGNTIRNYVGSNAPGAFYVPLFNQIAPLDGTRLR